MDISVKGLKALAVVSNTQRLPSSNTIERPNKEAKEYAVLADDAW